MKTYLTIILIFFASSLMAQPGDPSTDPDVPITGIEVLIGSGLALGFRHLLKRKKQ